MSLLLISNLLLWVLVLGLTLLVLVLARQIGVLHERIAPVGALSLDAGPKVGDAAPRLDLQTLDTQAFAFGEARPRSMLLFFLSPTCPVCKKLLPVLRAMHSSEARSLEIVLASDGERAEHERFQRTERLGGFPYLLSAELGLAFRVSKLPYAVLLDNSGIVRAKGLVNNREQIESLLEARELGVASLQEYRARQLAASPPTRS